MDASRYAELFLTESQEHVSAINHSLLTLERAPGASEPVAALFRGVHTIKGMAATMGYQAVTDLSHEMETLLDNVRKQAVRVDAGVMDVLFKGADALERTIEAETKGRPAADTGALLARMREISAAARPTPAAGATAVGEVPSAVGGVTVRVRLEPDTPLKGVRVFMILQKARTLGTLLATEPAEAVLQSGEFEGDFRLVIDSHAGAGEIEGAIKAAGFVQEAHVLAPAGGIEGPRSSAALRQSGAISPDTAEMRVSGTFPVPDAGTAAEGAVQHKHKNIRIDLRRLDTLMNLIGELVISRGRLQAIAAEVRSPVLDETLALASRLVSDLQDEIMTSRLVPVWQVFDRFPRLVRDAARSTGKDVDFVIEGKEIELDRSMLDEIGEPVVHLLRNAVDHGLEPPDERRAAGKPPVGRLRLAALRDRASVLIRVSDDGRGIDRSRVLAKAKRQGLVEESREELTDDEMYHLVARPGFSTTEQVTDLSGRGVGIDAVATRVRSLGGSLELRSVEGEGTTVTARLPVTLAIVRAVLAKVNDETYAVPMTHVSETMELAAGVHETVKGREVLSLRDDVLPLVHLRDLVKLPRQPDRLSHVIVLEMAERRAGILVDRLLGQQDIVVKQFDGVRDGLPLFSGATILGDGAPALILDVSTLL
ncbi:MAG: chemotaxis protein CheA [Gemmatimonadetes bacterium]|nr:chemotaxis protein CheA [Gemmatimonadota bacterium]